MKKFTMTFVVMVVFLIVFSSTVNAASRQQVMIEAAIELVRNTRPPDFEEKLAVAQGASFKTSSSQGPALGGSIGIDPSTFVLVSRSPRSVPAGSLVQFELTVKEDVYSNLMIWIGENALPGTGPTFYAGRYPGLNYGTWIKLPSLQAPTTPGVHIVFVQIFDLNGNMVAFLTTSFATENFRETDDTDLLRIDSAVLRNTIAELTGNFGTYSESRPMYVYIDGGKVVVPIKFLYSDLLRMEFLQSMSFLGPGYHDITIARVNGVHVEQSSLPAGLRIPNSAFRR